MARLVARGIALLVPLAMAVGSLTFLLSGGFFEMVRPDPPAKAQRKGDGERSAKRRARPRDQATPAERSVKRRARPRTRSTPAERAERAARRPVEAAGKLTGRLWALARPPLLAVLALALLLFASRAVARARRRYVRLALVPYRADEATPQAVAGLFDGWHQLTQARWWRRIACGQAGIALELHAEPIPAGGVELRPAFVCPDDPELVRALGGRLRGCYRHSGLGDPIPTPAPESVRRVVRLKRRSGHEYALGSEDRYDSALVDQVAGTMAEIGEPCTVQWSLVPAPAVSERLARAALRRKERELERRRERGGDPGARSELAEREIEGSVAGVLHRRLFFLELRVGAPTLRTARLVAGALRAGPVGETRMVERLAIVRAPLYRRRMRRGIGNPLPSFERGVVSSRELAALWQLPRPFLDGVAIRRASVPRIPAPPEIPRATSRERALCLDVGGAPLAIAPRDRWANAMLVGGQGTGKTSLMLRMIAAAAREENTCVVVLDPKSDLAPKALAITPRERTAWYVDLARAECGVDPFTADTALDAIADGIVAAFKDVNEDGQIQAASDRFLRYAAMSVVAWARDEELDEGPSLWDMYKLLIPGEEEFRQRVVASVEKDPELAAAALFFGQQLPDQLRKSPAQFVARLDAPTNKIQRVLVPQLDKVLRHPVTVDFDRAIAERQVVVVNGAVGHFGQDNTRVVLQIVLHMVHRALLRQQSLPERERAKVALFVDEAHMLFSGTFEQMLSMDRSAGLECVAAWQSLSQIEDRPLRSSILNLLRHKCVFSTSDEDARALATAMQTAFADVVRDDREARLRTRIAPDALINLPNHHAACSWLSAGARAMPFIARTLPMEVPDDVAAEHLARQRERGGHHPETLPPPKRVTGQEFRDPPVATPSPPDEPEPEPAPATEQPEFPPPATPETTEGEQRKPRVVGDGPLESLTELDMERVTGISWDRKPPRPPDRVGEPTDTDLEILKGLYELRFLLASQIARRYLAYTSERTQRRRLSELFANGWVRRFQLGQGTAGQKQRVYTLTRVGFELCQSRRGPRGPWVPKDSRWQERQIEDPRRVLHDLHVAAWLFAFEATCGKLVRDWRGPSRARLSVPGKMVRGEWIPMTPESLALPAGQRLRDLRLAAFEPVSPDAAVELALPTKPRRRLDVLVELDRTRRPSWNAQKFARYDALISGYAAALERYRKLGEPPIVVFVCDDDDQALAFCRTADEVVTGRIATAGDAEAAWPHPARRRILFVAERAIHERSLEAYRLPPEPPGLRRQLAGRGGRRARAVEPERVALLPERLLGR